MRLQISPDAADFVGANGGELWVWAERPPCCGGSPAWMRAAIAQPRGVSGFTELAVTDLADLRVHFRPLAGQLPEVLEVAMRGRRRRQVAAYWDGCIMAMV